MSQVQFTMIAEAGKWIYPSGKKNWIIMAMERKDLILFDHQLTATTKSQLTWKAPFPKPSG